MSPKKRKGFDFQKEKKLDRIYGITGMTFASAFRRVVQD